MMEMGEEETDNKKKDVCDHMCIDVVIWNCVPYKNVDRKECS